MAKTFMLELEFTLCSELCLTQIVQPLPQLNEAHSEVTTFTQKAV